MTERTREALLKRILDRLADALPEGLERAELRAALEANLALVLGTLEALEALRMLSTELPVMPDARTLLGCLQDSSCPIRRGLGALRDDHQRRLAAVHERVRAANVAPEMLEAYEALADSVLLGAALPTKRHPIAAALGVAVAQVGLSYSSAAGREVIANLSSKGQLQTSAVVALYLLSSVLHQAGQNYLQLLFKRLA